MSYVFIFINVVHVSLLITCKTMIYYSESGCLEIIEHGSNIDDGKDMESICKNMNIIKYVGCIIISLLY